MMAGYRFLLAVEATKYRRAADEEVFGILKQRRRGAGFIGTDGGEICHAQAD